MPMRVQDSAPGLRSRPPRPPVPFWILVFVPLLLFPAFAANQGVIEPGAKLELLAEIFGFTEGPAADAEGNVFFTDQPYNRIYRWSVADQLTVFHDNAGRANGLYFGKDGNLYACADLNNEIWRIDPSGKITVLVKEYEGKRLNGPNDLWIDPKGGIYFTDPFYRRDYWTHTAMPQERQHVYYLSPDHKKLTRVAADLEQPNGIIGTPDGKRLYVADIRAAKTYVYDILPDGSLSNKRLFASLGSDGMTMDEQENIYLTGKGVTVFNVRGEQIDQIEVPERWTANVTFGGKDRRWLFITASDSLYRIRTRVRGAH